MTENGFTIPARFLQNHGYANEQELAERNHALYSLLKRISTLTTAELSTLERMIILERSPDPFTRQHWPKLCERDKRYLARLMAEHDLGFRDIMAMPGAEVAALDIRH